MSDEILNPHVTARRVSPERYAHYLLLDKRGGKLGRAEWYAPWRQYVMVAPSTVIWSHDCLTVVARFLKAATAREKGVGDAP